VEITKTTPMKKFYFTICLFLPCLLAAQPRGNVENYCCEVVQISGPKITGVIYETGDSDLTLHGDKAHQSFGSAHISVYNIEVIKIRKKGNTGKGWFYGGLAGGVIGTIIGLGVPLKKTNSFGPYRVLEQTGNVLVGFGMGAVSGGLLGVLIGSASIKIPIEGNKKNYDDRRKELIKYSLMQK